MKTDSKDLFKIDFQEAFEVDDLPAECLDIIAKKNFRYTSIQGAERDALILEVLRKLETDTQVVGAPERTGVWEEGWAENLRMFKESGYKREALTPKFIRPTKTIRWKQDYVTPEDPMFELSFFEVLRAWLFKTYLAEVDVVYEFGCGTGFNLLALAELFPEKELHGLDFVNPPKDIVNIMASEYNLNMQGHVFDMRKPDKNLSLKANSAVVHLGTVEQLASDIEPFLEYVLDQKPAICVAMEPTIELYDESNLIDYLAASFHRKRGYTEGYLPRLRELEAQKKIEILKVKRTYFGSFFMEGFSVMVWRPV